MPLYLYQAGYTADSLATQMKNPSDRLETVAKQIQATGVKFVGGGFSFGEHDLAILDGCAGRHGDGRGRNRNRRRWRDTRLEDDASAERCRVHRRAEESFEGRLQAGEVVARRRVVRPKRPPLAPRAPARASAPAARASR